MKKVEKTPNPKLDPRTKPAIQPKPGKAQKAGGDEDETGPDG